ncbi:protein ALP1-like [Asparagus officinalis]|uniref:protein ALP1-like n=1 Tax=Asparagus officinalis TaxID=4686 RepID=UPI00098E524B|nr:protein ALP1-like [Asparagus officinalis]
MSSSSSSGSSLSENALKASQDIQLTILLEDQSRYGNRKEETSTNVLGVCDANLRFSYVLPGWEGSTLDSRVLRDALRRPKGLKLPSNKYFLVDAGYTNGLGFFAPYRGTRYHIKSWRENGPRNYKELFNQRHPSARNTIERAFGLLKKRWAILRTASFYSVKTQIRIINACCILHNFLREEMNEDDLLNDMDQELEDALVLEIENVDEECITTVRVTDEWSTFRDDLAMQMWDEYRL